MDGLSGVERGDRHDRRREIVIARHDRLGDLEAGSDYLEVTLTPDLARRAMFGGAEVEPKVLARQIALHRAFVRIGGPVEAAGPTMTSSSSGQSG